MYGLPKDIDLGFFIGKTLLQACFGAQDLILNFDGDVQVTVTSSLGSVDASGSIRQHDDFRQIAGVVLELVNHVILSADGDQAGTLTLRFNNGGILAIYDDSKEYESYTIRNGDQLFVV